jgi:hypothetical protein
VPAACRASSSSPCRTHAARSAAESSGQPGIALKALRPPTRSALTASAGEDDEPNNPYIFKETSPFLRGALLDRNVGLLRLPNIVARLALDRGLPLDSSCSLAQAVVEAVSDQWKELTGPAVAWPRLPPLITEIDLDALAERAGQPDWVPSDDGDEDGVEAPGT